MGQISLNGATYLVGKHNHYNAGLPPSSQPCPDYDHGGTVPPPCYEVVVLKADTLEKVDSFLEPATPANE
jgi:hypothetical protein